MITRTAITIQNMITDYNNMEFSGWLRISSRGGNRQRGRGPERRGNQVWTLATRAVQARLIRGSFFFYRPFFVCPKVSEMPGLAEALGTRRHLFAPTPLQS